MAYLLLWGDPLPQPSPPTALPPPSPPAQGVHAPRRDGFPERDGHPREHKRRRIVVDRRGPSPGAGALSPTRAAQARGVAVSAIQARTRRGVPR